MTLEMDFIASLAEDCEAMLALSEVDPAEAEETPVETGAEVADMVATNEGKHARRLSIALSGNVRKGYLEKTTQVPSLQELLNASEALSKNCKRINPVDLIKAKSLSVLLFFGQTKKGKRESGDQWKFECRLCCCFTV